MKDGRFIAVGPASEVMTEAALTATYEVDVTVYTHPSRMGSDQSQMCSVWLPERD